MILSAKYGLLSETDIVEPYDLSLFDLSRQDRIQWGREVTDKLTAINPNTVTLLCGNEYSRYLDLSKFTVLNPLKGLGIGKRIQFLSENT